MWLAYPIHYGFFTTWLSQCRKLNNEIMYEYRIGNVDLHVSESSNKSKS